MTAKLETDTILPADREHNALRAVVLLLIFGGMWLGYRLILLIWGWSTPDPLPDYARLASCAGAIPLGLVLAWAVEELLLHTWHSGNYVILRRDQVCVQRRGAEAACLPLGTNTAVSAYYFSLRDYARGGRERRAPRRWLCVAVQLAYEEEQAVIFALLPPAKAAAYTSSETFQEIRLSEVYGREKTRGLPMRPSIPAEVLRGEYGRFWAAERYRWEFGMELSAPDFATFMDFVQHQVNGN